LFDASQYPARKALVNPVIEISLLNFVTLLSNWRTAHTRRRQDHAPDEWRAVAVFFSHSLVRLRADFAHACPAVTAMDATP